MTSILITGATGFIGRACLDVLLDKNWEIHAIYHKRPPLDNHKIYWHTADILDHASVTQLIKQISPTYLLHLAWIVDHQVFWSTDKNIDYIAATVHLYHQFSLHGGQKAIFLGTCAEYDRVYTDCDEEATPLNPTTLYGLCKKQTLELLNQLKLNHPDFAKFSWIRLFNIYGPHEHPDRLIPYIFLSYLKGKTPVLNNPYAIRDHIYVENIAILLIHLLEQETPVVINFGSGFISSIDDIANYIHQTYFKSFPAPNKTQQNTIVTDRLVPLLARLKNLNLPPLVSLEVSLDKTYQWLLMNKGI